MDITCFSLGNTIEEKAFKFQIMAAKPSYKKL